MDKEKKYYTFWEEKEKKLEKKRDMERRKDRDCEYDRLRSQKKEKEDIVIYILRYDKIRLDKLDKLDKLIGKLNGSCRECLRDTIYMYR